MWTPKEHSADGLALKTIVVLTLSPVIDYSARVEHVGAKHKLY